MLREGICGKERSLFSSEWARSKSRGRKACSHHQECTVPLSPSGTCGPLSPSGICGLTITIRIIWSTLTIRNMWSTPIIRSVWSTRTIRNMWSHYHHQEPVVSLSPSGAECLQRPSFLPLGLISPNFHFCYVTDCIWRLQHRNRCRYVRIWNHPISEQDRLCMTCTS